MFIGLLNVCAIESFDKSLAFNLKFLSLKNQSKKTNPTIIDINSNENLFHPFTVSVIKCGGSCNTVDDPYAQVFVVNKVEIMNLKVFSLVLHVNETGIMVQQEPCKCKFGNNKCVCNPKQK